MSPKRCSSSPLVACSMAPRTLQSLAHALASAPDLDAALVALGEGLAEVDRTAYVALLRYDGRREMIVDRLTPTGGTVGRTMVETTFDHLGPGPPRRLPRAEFIDLGDQSQEYARLFGMMPFADGGMLASAGSIRRVSGRGRRPLRGRNLRDPRVEALRAVRRPLQASGSRGSPSAGRATRRYGTSKTSRTGSTASTSRNLALERRLAESRGRAPEQASRLIELEAEIARANEETRLAGKRAEELEQQVAGATPKFEQMQGELHRRSELLRQKTRTLYLIDKVMTLDNAATDPRKLIDGLLALVGDDMAAQRCSLMLMAPEPGYLYLAAARGLAPHIVEGSRIAIGEGVAGRVAASREPILVQDVEAAQAHPLLRDQYFTTGSFISFPLIYHDTLVGVVNLTNRAQRGVFIEEDVERVRLLGLVISLVVSHARFVERPAAPPSGALVAN